MVNEIPYEGPISWALAQLKPNGYKLAVSNLLQQGIEAFMPIRKITKPIRGRVVTQHRPLFPGYLFVFLNDAPSTPRKINSTYGITRLVTLGGHTPSTVPSSLIEELLARCDANGLLLPATQWAAGDRARVVSGPFTKIIGDIEDAPEDGRVYLLMPLMGHTVRTQLDCSDIEHVV